METNTKNVLRKIGVSDDSLNSINYKKLYKRNPKNYKMDKYQIMTNNAYQMDIFELPTFNNYRYVLNIINMKTKISDVEPLKSKDAVTTTEALKKIIERNVIENPIKFLYVDNGFYSVEFYNYANVQMKFNVIYSRPNNHRQMAMVESSNGSYKRVIMRYLSLRSLEIGHEFNNWVSILFQVRDELNIYAKEKHPIYIDWLTMEEPDDDEKFQIGDEVHVKLDYVENLFNRTKKDNERFRHGDRRFSNETYRIIGILRTPGKQLRYQLQDFYGSLPGYDLLKA